MSAPRFVPKPPARRVRTYQSPPRRPTPWLADRPGELDGLQPEGALLGSQGPDQGYALTIAKALAPSLHLHTGEHLADVLAGAAAVATKRSSLFGRAPMREDLDVAFGIWGFLRKDPSKELVELRRELFEECHVPHFYERTRRIADAVPAEVLEQSSDDILALAKDDWRTVIHV